MHHFVEPKPPSEDEPAPDEPWWNRPWTKRRTLLAYFLAGWAGAIAIMAIGDYQLRHRLPTLSELGTYILLGLVLAPIIAAAGSLMSAGTRRRLRNGGSVDQ